MDPMLSRQSLDLVRHAKVEIYLRDAVRASLDLSARTRRPSAPTGSRPLAPPPPPASPLAAAAAASSSSASAPLHGHLSGESLKVPQPLHHSTRNQISLQHVLNASSRTPSPSPAAAAATTTTTAPGGAPAAAVNIVMSSVLPSDWEAASTGTVQNLDFTRPDRAAGLSMTSRNKKQGGLLDPTASPPSMTPSPSPSESEDESAATSSADESPQLAAIDMTNAPPPPPLPTSSQLTAKQALKKGASVVFGKLKKVFGHGKMGQWPTTAIAGNDCTSSILYTSGLCATMCGKLSPIALMLVTVPLFFYRFIYSEVVTSLPLNGGIYNVLLNGITKKSAATASVLIILSYIATAVVSADSASSYLYTITDKSPKFWITIVILAVFAGLSLFGIRDSAFVAIAFFFHHLFVMCLLAGFSIYAWANLGFSVFNANWSAGPKNGNYAEDLWFGYASAILGVTGFESASNFIESQTPGAFPKALRNIWLVLSLQNVVIEMLLTGIVPITEITDETVGSALTLMADKTGHKWLSTWVAVDAILVLSGAVLTSYVGIIGLVERLARDRCLPQFLLGANRCFHTQHWIIITFFILTTLLYVVTGGSIVALSGVYTVAFLSVMILIGLGNLILKYKRASLPRPVTAHWTIIIAGMAMIAIGLAGNVVHDPTILIWFCLYFIGVLAVIYAILHRTNIISIILHSGLVHPRWHCLYPITSRLEKFLLNQYKQRHDVIVFLKHPDLPLLRKTVQYVSDNELTSNTVTIVHFYRHTIDIPLNLIEYTAILDAMFSKLTVNLLLIHGSFNAKNVDRLSRTLDVPRNWMFISCPDNESPIAPEELTGIRIIAK